MHSTRSGIVSLLSFSVLLAGCAQQAAKQTSSSSSGPKSAAAAAPTKVTKIEPGADAQKRAQTALIEATPGEVIEFAPGRFEFTSTLSLDVNGVTIRGAGNDKTILAFNQQGQGTGGEGILVTSKEKFLIENLAIEDAKGDAIKVTGCKGVTFRGVRTGWTRGAHETNGGYGLYPVLSTDILIEDCVIREASDAGIYVGQSENIIVRRNRVERNVAGIEIENSFNADVYDNTATDNTGGILVFALPDLPEKKSGEHCRVYNNQIVANNHVNFAPAGNMVAAVPVGTGVMILANQKVEVFDNTIENNQNIGITICSYFATQRPFTDAGYDPYCDSIYLHDNKISGCGSKPNGKLGELISSINDGKLPAIVYDGVVDPKKAVDGALPPELAIRIRNNGDADFINFDFKGWDFSNPLDIKMGKISRDLKPHEGEMQTLTPVTIAGVD